jgi:hypothetical protein
VGKILAMIGVQFPFKYLFVVGVNADNQNIFFVKQALPHLQHPLFVDEVNFFLVEQLV